MPCQLTTQPSCRSHLHAHTHTALQFVAEANPQDAAVRRQLDEWRQMKEADEAGALG